MGAAYPYRPLSRQSVAIAAFSTIVEWYDFTLYLYLATVLSRVFFGGGAAGMAHALATFALAYLMRPLGAMAFGHIGDRYGRRPAMLLAMALMTVAMLATATLPTYADVGYVSGLALLGLRCVMAFSVGGEYTGVVAYLLEGAPPTRRGFMTSLAAAASEVGGLLAAGVSAVIVLVLSADDLVRWGWRVPFLIGGCLAGFVLLIRSTIEESPDFARQKAEGSVPERPLRHSLLRHKLAIARGFAISALGSITYYVGITYVPSFLTAVASMTERDALLLSTIAAVAVIAITPIVGHWTDVVGRRPVLIVLAIANLLLPIPLFSLMTSGEYGWALGGAIILACLGGAVSAAGAVATAEQFPGEGRLSGLAFGATTATALFGGVTPYLAHQIIGATGWSMVPGIMIALVSLCVLPVMIYMQETTERSRDILRQ